ncbi:MAG TPA: Flp family type IVb pilin [Rhizomicrobium sp.]|nr:Flp family type IVb pilin [Rhizomicrobium sp.]
MRAFARDERGATAIEYGLIAALICVTVIAAIQLVSQTIQQTFYDKIVQALQG